MPKAVAALAPPISIRGNEPDTWSFVVPARGKTLPVRVTCRDPRALPNSERRRVGRAQLILIRMNRGTIPSAEEDWAMDAFDTFFRRVLVDWDARYPSTYHDKSKHGELIPVAVDGEDEWNPLDPVDGYVYDEIVREVLDRLSQPPKSG